MEGPTRLSLKTGMAHTWPFWHLSRQPFDTLKQLQRQRKTALLKRSKTQKGLRADSAVLHNISYPRDVTQNPGLLFYLASLASTLSFAAGRRLELVEV